MSRSRVVMLLAQLALVVPLGGFGCGSEQGKIDRGVNVAPEEAVPDSPKEDELTEAQRKKQQLNEEEQPSPEAYDDSEQATD